MIPPLPWETAKEYMLRVVPPGDKCMGEWKCQYFVNEHCDKWNWPIKNEIRCGYCKGAVVHPKKGD